MRRALAVVAVAALLAVAGCSGPSDRTPEPMEPEASRATVGDAALSEAGYSEATVEQGRLNASGTLAVSGDVQLSVNYIIHATTYRAVYVGEGGDPPPVLAVYSVPVADPDDVATTIDPLRDRNRTEVATLAQDRYGGFGGLDPVGNESATLLGGDVAMAKYATTATADGESVEVFVYFARVEHEGDVVWTVAVLPRAADDPGAVRALVEAVEH